MEYNSGSNRASNFKSAQRVARGRFEITSPITPELYDTKSYYQLIVPITKCENPSLGIFINVRNRFQSKKMTGFNFGYIFRRERSDDRKCVCVSQARPHEDLFSKKHIFN